MRTKARLFTGTVWLLAGLTTVTEGFAAGRDGDDTEGRREAFMKKDSAGANVAASLTVAGEKAATGDPQAQFLLGLFQDMGVGLALDQDRAQRVLVKAAGGKAGLAAAYLSWRYENGFGLNKPDPVLATRWRRATPSNLVVPPELDRWIVLEKGQVRPRFAEALAWMQREAEEGNRVAQANLALVYLREDWVKKDLEMHMKWLRRAADGGEAGSLELLAGYRRAGVFLPRDADAAWTNTKLAVEKGSASAQVLVGDALAGGQAGQADAAEAARFYRMALAQKHPPALVRLIELLETGGPGLPMDIEQADRLLASAREDGDLDWVEDVADLYSFAKE